MTNIQDILEHSGGNLMIIINQAQGGYVIERATSNPRLAVAKDIHEAVSIVRELMQTHNMVLSKDKN